MTFCPHQAVKNDIRIGNCNSITVAVIMVSTFNKFEYSINHYFNLPCRRSLSTKSNRIIPFTKGKVLDFFVTYKRDVGRVKRYGGGCRGIESTSKQKKKAMK